jgi:hypothetical protein
MLYLLIEGVPKCQSELFTIAEGLLVEADPDLYEMAHRLTCAYSAGVIGSEANRRDMALHAFRRVLGKGVELEWVNYETHAQALTELSCPRAL